jgi:hypothetical protein
MWAFFLRGFSPQRPLSDLLLSTPRGRREYIVSRRAAELVRRRPGGHYEFCFGGDPVQALVLGQTSLGMPAHRDRAGPGAPWSDHAE